MMLNDNQRNVILALVDNNLNVSEVARIMHYHRNTIVYHIETVKKMTGLDPMTFSGMERLLWRLADEAAERELKNCPFCGGEASVKITPVDGGGFKGSVRCSDCTVSVVTPKHKTRMESEECATAMWNRRVKAHG